jgi:hypothetical protein
MSIKQALLMVASVGICIGILVYSYFVYNAGFVHGYEAKQTVIVETHPLYVKMNECVKYYANRKNWTGLFSKVWYGEGYGYSAAEGALGIAPPDDNSWFKTHQETCEQCKTGKPCEAMIVREQDRKLRWLIQQSY